MTYQNEVKEIDQDIVIKMFDHLKGLLPMANQNELQSRPITKPSVNLKLINFYVCNGILSEN